METLFHTQHRFQTGGTVNPYFYRVYRQLESKGLNPAVAKLAHAYPDYQIWVTGHSLGGALATIASGEMISHYGIDSNRILLMTFGQPRVGNEKYSRKLDAILKNNYR